MNYKRDLTGIRPRLADFLFCTLLFSYPLLSFLWRRSYPLLTLEVFGLVSIIVGVSLVLSFLFARISSAISYLLTATLVLLSFLIQFDLSFVGMVLCLFVTAILLLMFRQHFRVYSLAILTGLLLGAYLDSKYEPLPDRSEENIPKVDAGLAPIVHILFDGFIGVGGLPKYPASELIKKEILSFFETNQFELYTHAYSRYARTGESVYTSMNYRHDFDSSFAIELALGSDHVMRQNALFTSVEDLGYRLNVYQTGHMDLCQSNRESLDRCWQYPLPNVHSAIESENTRLRFIILIKTLLGQSRLLRVLLADARWYSSVEVAVHEPRLFEVLSQDIQKRAMGNYFFAHALIPHGPFIYQADCSASYDLHPALTVGRGRNEPVLSELSEDVYEVRNGLYFGQIDCALKNLQSLIDGMKNDGNYDRAIIIVHGDHGSRIGPYSNSFENQHLLRQEHYRAEFSTLFAVKYPGSEFSISEQALPIPYLLEEFLLSLPSYVYVADNYPTFRPSLEASPEKVDSYIYLQSGPLARPIAIDLFKD
jgi:hypothetical protein